MSNDQQKDRYEWISDCDAEWFLQFDGHRLLTDHNECNVPPPARIIVIEDDHSPSHGFVPVGFGAPLFLTTLSYTYCFQDEALIAFQDNIHVKTQSLSVTAPAECVLDMFPRCLFLTRFAIPADGVYSL